MTLAEFDQLWDYDDPAASEARFRGLLPDARASGGLALELQLRTQIARALALQRRFAAAQQMLDKLAARLDEADDLTRLRWLLESGRVLNSGGAAQQAEPLFRRAWELARTTGEDFHAIDAAHMLAIVASTAAEQHAWNRRALELAETTPEPRARKWPGSLHNNMGWTEHEAGNYERALIHFQQAQAWRERQGDAGAIRVARWCVARCLRSLGRVEEALARQRDLLAELDSAGESDGYTLEEVAECMLALDLREEARPWFARAHAALAQDGWLREQEPQRLARLRALADAH